MTTDEIDTMNHFGVTVMPTGKVCALLLQGQSIFTKADALNFAAYLVVMATLEDDDGKEQFVRHFDAIAST